MSPRVHPSVFQTLQIEVRIPDSLFPGAAARRALEIKEALRDPDRRMKISPAISGRNSAAFDRAGAFAAIGRRSRFPRFDQGSRRISFRNF